MTRRFGEHRKQQAIQMSPQKVGGSHGGHYT